MGQLVIFRTGICEDINIGPWQGYLQSNLNGTDAHLWTVSTSLRKRRISSENGDYTCVCEEECEPSEQFSDLSSKYVPDGLQPEVLYNTF